MGEEIRRFQTFVRAAEECLPNTEYSRGERSNLVLYPSNENHGAPETILGHHNSKGENHV